MIKNPFPGPKPYRAADRGQFFGREELSYKLEGKLLASRCVTIHGPSGAGKSSIMQAAVLPRLIESQDIRVVRVDAWPEGEAPTKWLEMAMYGDLKLGAPPADLDHKESVLFAAKRAARGSARLMIVYLDQLEQLLYPDRSVEDVEAFFDCIEALADLPLRTVRLVLSLREDYLGRLRDRLRDRQRVLDQGFRVGPLTVRELTSAVVLAAAMGEPAQTWSTPKVRELMLQVRVAGQSATDEAEAQSAYAQIVCRALFQQWAQSGRANEDDIDAQAIVQKYFESTLADLGPLRPPAERLLEDHLVTADGSRTLRTEKELLRILPETDLSPILRALESAACLTAAEHQGSRYFELGHDWLARRVFEARKKREEQEAEAARVAEQQKKLQAAVERESRRRRTLRSIAVGLGVFAGVTGILGLLALKSKLAADDEREKVEVAMAAERAARHKAVRATVEAHDQKVLAAYLTLVGRGDLPWALKLLMEVRRPAEQQGWVSYASDALASNGLRVSLRGHQGALTSASFSPDKNKKKVLTAATDGMAFVWSADGRGKPMPLRGHTAAIHEAVWSPDAARILTLSDDMTARIFRAEDGALEVTLAGAKGGLVHGGFSPDGKRVVAGSEDGKARVYDIEGHLIQVLEGHSKALTYAAFLPDGQHIVTASEDATARVWDGGAQWTSVILKGHEGAILSVATTRDGKFIVTGSRDKTARVFSADGKEKPIVLEGHEGSVSHVDVSLDGTLVATASVDGRARIFSIDGKKPPRVLHGHSRAVTWVAFGPLGTLIATASLDKTARLYSLDGEDEEFELRGHDSPVGSVAWSPDGAMLVTTAVDAADRFPDRSAKIWSATAVRSAPTDLEAEGALHAAAVDIERSRVVAAYDDDVARIYALRGKSTPIILKGHSGWISSVAFSPKGDRVVTASLDKTARVWSADGKGESVVLRGHEAEVRHAAFSADGSRVVTASEDKTARIWNADGTGAPIVLRGHEDWLTCAAFSPDGKLVATGSLDHTVRIHRADGQGESVVLRAHGGPVYSVAFDPAGKHLVTSSEDGTTRVWNADGSGTSTLLGSASNMVGAVSKPNLLSVWTADSSRVAIASIDGLIRIWKADGTGLPVLLEAGIPSMAMAFFDDGQQLFAARSDGSVHSWMIDVDRLKGALEIAHDDCIPPLVRILTLTEPEATAQYKSAKCESRYGRAQEPPGEPPPDDLPSDEELKKSERDAMKPLTPSGQMVSQMPVRKLPLLRDLGPDARRVKLIVLPGDAEVEIGGSSARRRDGLIEVIGKLGEIERLRVSADGQYVETEIKIGDGVATPEIIDLRERISAKKTPSGKNASNPLLRKVVEDLEGR